PEERAIFSRIVTNDYRVVAASVEGFPSDARYTFIPENIARREGEEPMFVYKRWKDRDVRLFYSFGGDVARVEAFARRLGAKVTRVHREKAVRYFPHFSTRDIRAGVYERLESLQGARRTYYTGEIFDFSTVESVSAYSRALV